MRGCQCLAGPIQPELREEMPSKANTPRPNLEFALNAQREASTCSSRVVKLARWNSDGQIEMKRTSFRLRDFSI